MQDNDQPFSAYNTESAGKVLPRSLLPMVDNETELAHLISSVGQTGKNELQRSEFYRIKPQVDFVRSFLPELQDVSALDVLNIGPANLQEAAVLGVLAQNQGLLARTKIEYVDLVRLDMVQPELSLGINILGQPVAPPAVDSHAYVFADGEWRVGPEVQDFIYSSLDSSNNSFATAIENHCRTASAMQYGIVTFNNVAQYLGLGAAKYDNPIYTTSGEFTSFQAVILSVAEMTRPGGLLLSQVTRGITITAANPSALDKYFHLNTNFSDVFEVVNAKAGIYKRLTADQLQLSYS